MEMINAETLRKITARNTYKRDLMYDVEIRLKEEAENGQCNTACSGKGLVKLTYEQVQILKENGYTVDYQKPGEYVICW